MASYEDDVCRALAASLEPIEGLQQSAYMLSSPTPPTAEVLPGEINWDQAFQRGLDEFFVTVRVTVGSSLSESMQKRLRDFRAPDGPSSVKTAIEADKKLGGLVQSLQVTATSPVRQFRRPNGDTVLGCDFSVRVFSA